jgi:hypothetical protein
MVIKEDLQASVAELVYGKPLRIPSKLQKVTADPVDATHLITQFRQHIAHLRSVPAACHASPATFMHYGLYNCSQVFLWQDTTSRALEPPYSGPYQVLSQREKTLRLLVHGWPITIINQEDQAGLHVQRD